MSGGDDVRAIRAALADPRRVVRALGIEKGSVPCGQGLLILCPWHSEKTPSCSVHLGRDRTIAVRCWGCDASGDVLTLTAAVHGLNVRQDFRAVLQEGARLAGVQLEDRKPRGARSPTVRPRLAPSIPRPEPEAAERPCPPESEVRELLYACRPCSRDAEVAAWLRSRALDPKLVDQAGLAFALPRDARLPRWARFRGARPKAEPWPALGYRVLLPLRDAEGRIRSVRARSIAPVPGAPKALPPSGFRLSGLILADSFGSMLLQLGVWPPGARQRVVITEGEPDYLTWATAPAAVGRSVAVWGITGAGVWTQALADRIPDGSLVIVWTDSDRAGDRYVEEIAVTLRGRCTIKVSDPEGRRQRREAGAA